MCSNFFWDCTRMGLFVSRSVYKPNVGILRNGTYFPFTCARNKESSSHNCTISYRAYASFAFKTQSNKMSARAERVRSSLSYILLGNVVLFSVIYIKDSSSRLVQITHECSTLLHEIFATRQFHEFSDLDRIKPEQNIT